MYYVYVVKSSKDGSLYKGITQDVNRRTKEHNAGETKSIKSKIPFKLVYLERVTNRMEARKREVWLKSGVGREYLKSIIPR